MQTSYVILVSAINGAALKKTLFVFFVKFNMATIILLNLLLRCCSTLNDTHYLVLAYIPKMRGLWKGRTFLTRLIEATKFKNIIF